jgi:4-aminobutyrate aminotransferase-like enzyme
MGEVQGSAATLAFAGLQDVLDASGRYWNPDRTRFWVESGVPLVIDRREGYFRRDLDGKRLIDVHLNGGTCNLGHRNLEVVAALVEATAHVDIGNSQPPLVFPPHPVASNLRPSGIS